MSPKSKFAILYADDVSIHIDAIERKHHRLIESAIIEQLSHAPNVRTRNRKPLDDIPGPLGATWELRFGPDNRFRVFYELAEDEKVVWILAIGVKDGNQLFIGGEEFEA